MPARLVLSPSPRLLLVVLGVTPYDSNTNSDSSHYHSDCGKDIADRLCAPESDPVADESGRDSYGNASENGYKPIVHYHNLQIQSSFLVRRFAFFALTVFCTASNFDCGIALLGGPFA